MSRFGAQYQVSKPTGTCAHSGAELQPGETYIATLCERAEDEGLERRDFSCAAWDEGVRPEGLFSYWKSIVPQPGTQRRLVIDDTVLCDLFERLADDERPQRVAFRFVLGLILMRKKLIKLVGRVEADLEAGTPERWLIVHRGEDAAATGPIELVNPQLAEEDIRELSDQLGEVLQSEF